MSKLFDKILIALPQDDDAAIGLTRVGMSIARVHDAQVRLFSVVSVGVAATPSSVGMPGTEIRMPDAPKVTDAAVASRHELLTKILSAHSSREGADQSVVVGDPSSEIVAEADRWGADMIIVGARDRGWLERLFDPSISQTVAKKADCVVMVFPELDSP